MLKLFTSKQSNESFRNYMKANKIESKAPTTKQQYWLKTAVKEYHMVIKNKPATRLEASILIEKISLAIAQGSVKLRKSNISTVYAIVEMDKKVGIKAFRSTSENLAKAKAFAKYNNNIKHMTTSLEYAKKIAKNKVKLLNQSNVSEMKEAYTAYQDNVDKYEEKVNDELDEIVDMIKELELSDIRSLAKEYHVNLGNSRKIDTIIRKFREQLVK